MAPQTAAAAPSSHPHVSIPFLTCSVCRGAVEANVDAHALTEVATGLYRELNAASHLIIEMLNAMTAPQKRIVADKLHEAGHLNLDGGMTRYHERNCVLAAAQALGIK